MDLIEINSFKTRMDDLGLISEYSFTLIQLGYVTLFACIIPLASLILLVLFIIQIRAALFSLNYNF